MKNITIIIALLSLPFQTWAQVTTSENKFENDTNKEIEYLTPSGGTHGFYFGMGSSFAHLGNTDFISFESRIAYVADQKFEFGLGSQVFHDVDNLFYNSDTTTYIAGALGGFHFKAIFQGHKKIHFSIPVLIGGGSAGVFTDYNGIEWNESFEDEDSWSPFLFIEPGINVELNINKIIGFELGAKYMLTTNSDTNIAYYENLNGPKIQAMLKIGIFGLGSKKQAQQKKLKPISNGDYLDL